jgi:putative membrane protein
MRRIGRSARADPDCEQDSACSEERLVMPIERQRAFHRHTLRVPQGRSLTSGTRLAIPLGVDIRWFVVTGPIPLGLALVACARTSTPAGAPGPGAPGAPLDDGQITEIVDTMDVQQIRTARLAVGRASDPQVRSYAQQVLADHRREQQANLDLIAQERLEVQPSILTQLFDTATRDDRAWLSNESGSTFDRDFLAAQVKEQSLQLDSLDHMLVPGAHDADLRLALIQRRAIAARLLDEASHLIRRFPAPP